MKYDAPKPQANAKIPCSHTGIRSSLPVAGRARLVTGQIATRLVRPPRLIAKSFLPAGSEHKTTRTNHLMPADVLAVLVLAFVVLLLHVALR